MDFLHGLPWGWRLFGTGFGRNAGGGARIQIAAQAHAPIYT